MKHYKGAKLAIAGAAAMLATGTAFAQSSVTLYGIVDTGLVYLNSQAPSTGATTGGHSVIKLEDGIWGGSRFGLKGSEDLGGGTKAIFQLEERYSSDTGAQKVAGSMFYGSAWVGLTNATAGTFTAGRQYAPYYTLLAQNGPTPWLTGAFGAHPGDIDNMDTDYRINNALIYTSPTFAGLTFGGMYALGGVAGSTGAGQSWSLAARYLAGPAAVAVGFERFNNSTIGGGAWGNSSTANTTAGTPGTSNLQGNSALTAGYATAAAQQRLAVTAGYTFNSQWDVSAAYSNVQYIAGANNAFSTAIFNTGGAVMHFRPVVDWDLAAGYAYTRATKANGITDAASYQQVNLTEMYNLSKRTKIYVLEAYQHANGQTLNSSGKVANATAQIAEQSAASCRSQFGATVGINHQF